MRRFVGIPSLFVVAVFLLGSTTGTVTADFDELLKKVPPDANSLVFVNGQQIAKASKTAKESFLKEYLAAAETCPATMPEGTEHIIMAAQFDVQHMAPQWQMATIRFGNPVSAETVAKRHNGVVDNLSGTDVVWIEGAAVIVTGEKELTFVSPLNRQSASRWISDAKARTDVGVSPYLREAAKLESASNAEIVMVLDLENVFGPEEIKRSVEKAPIFRNAKAETITKIINSIRGVTIVCQVVTKQSCTIHVDFGEETAPLDPYADPMIRGILRSAGATLDGFEDWSIKTEGKRIVMEGNLTPSSLRRVLSIYSIGSVISQPDNAVAKTDEKTAEPAAEPAKDNRTPEQIAQDEKTSMQRATRRYFRAVDRRIVDLRDDDRMNAVNLRRTAYWINNYANEIDRLTVRNVDPEVIEYGRWVSSTFKQIVYELHSAENQFQYNRSSINPIGPTTVTAVPDRRINYGGHVRYSYAPMVTQQLNIGSAMYDRAMMWEEGVSKGNQSALDSMRNIEIETDKIRDTMTDRYGIKF